MALEQEHTSHAGYSQRAPAGTRSCLCLPGAARRHGKRTALPGLGRHERLASGWTGRSRAALPLPVRTVSVRNSASQAARARQLPSRETGPRKPTAGGFRRDLLRVALERTPLTACPAVLSARLRPGGRRPSFTGRVRGSVGLPSPTAGRCSPLSTARRLWEGAENVRRPW